MSSGLNKATGGLDKLGQKMQSVGAKMTASLTVPIVAAGAAGVKMAMDLDEAMRNIQSVGGQTNEELKALSDTFVDMSTDLTKTTDSAQALASAFYDIQGSGFEGADAMKVLEAATMAATAGLTDTHTAAQGVTAVLNSYGMAAEDAAFVSDLMFTTVDRGVGSFEELVTSMNNVVPSASAMGIQYEEISAAIATMSKQGQSFANATTNLNGVITGFLKPSEAMKKAISDLGYESAQSMIDTLGLGGAMQALEQYTGGSAEKMGELFGDVRAMRGAFALTGDGARMFAEDLEAMGAANGRTAEAFATQTEAFAAQWKNFQNVLNALLIEVGQTLIPILSDLIQNYLIPAIQWFRNLPEPVKKGIIAFAGLVAVLGPVLMFIGGIISAISTIGAAISALAPVFAAIGAALAALSGPVIIIIAIITALIAAIVALWMNREKVKEWAQGVWEGMKKAGNAVSEGAKAWEGNFEMMGVIAKEGASRITQWLSQMATNIVKSFQQIFPAMKKIGVNIIKGLIEGVKSMINNFINMVRDLAQSVVDTVTSVLKIKSPSKVMQGLGEQVVAGFNKGIDSMQGIGVNVNGTSLSGGGTTPSVAASGGGGRGINIGTLILQPTSANIYDEINRKLARDAQKKGASRNR